MTTYDIIAQAIGLVAMAFNILSYQQKSSSGAIACQLFGSALFSASFFMLGATVGGIMNLIGAVRAIVFVNKKKLRADHVGWLVFFIVVYLLSYVFTFTVFGKAFTLRDGILELLPIVAMIATTVSFRLESTKVIRRYGLISSPCWLVYNIASTAVGAIVCEVISLLSIAVGMLRYDIKKSQQEEQL